MINSYNLHSICNRICEHFWFYGNQRACIWKYFINDQLVAEAANVYVLKKLRCLLKNMSDDLMRKLWLVFSICKWLTFLISINQTFYFPNEIIKNSSLWWLRMAAGGGNRLALMCTLRCCDCVHAGRHYQSHYIEVAAFLWNRIWDLDWFWAGWEY